MADRRTDSAQQETLAAWRRCTVCGSNYPVSQTVCYTCWRRAKPDERTSGNLLSSRFAESLRTVCGSRLPENLIRLNVDYPIPAEISGQFYRGGGRCFECAEKSYCRLFGNPYYTCRREDWEYCKCRMCCKAFRDEAARKAGG